MTDPVVHRHVHRRGQGRDGTARNGLGSLALSLQRLQRLADLLGGRSQVWLLLLQLGEQRLEDVLHVDRE